MSATRSCCRCRRFHRPLSSPSDKPLGYTGRMDLSDRVFHAQLEDYISARGELVGAISNQHMALTFGTGALVAAFGAGFLSWAKPITPAIFIGIVPLSWWILTMWLGEVVRMLRAAEFCGDQEQILNESIRRQDPSQLDPLRWEGWRRKDDAPWRTITWTYTSVALLLLCTNAAAMTCWTVTAIQSHWECWVIVVIWILALALGLPFVRWVLMTFQTWSAADVGMPSSRFVRVFERLPLSRRHKGESPSR